jgi:hypothetical protein
MRDPVHVREGFSACDGLADSVADRVTGPLGGGAAKAVAKADDGSHGFDGLTFERRELVLHRMRIELVEIEVRNKLSKLRHRQAAEDDFGSCVRDDGRPKAEVSVLQCELLEVLMGYDSPKTELAALVESTTKILSREHLDLVDEKIDGVDGCCALEDVGQQVVQEQPSKELYVGGPQGLVLTDVDDKNAVLC